MQLCEAHHGDKGGLEAIFLGYQTKQKTEWHEIQQLPEVTSKGKVNDQKSALTRSTMRRTILCKLQLSSQMKFSDFQREHCITLDATVDDTLQAALLHERDTPGPMYYKNLWSS